ncbi:MAG: PAS domain S-box protein [Chitinophagales bacterium]
MAIQPLNSDDNYLKLANLAMALEGAPFPFIAFTSKGTIISFNSALSQLLGYSESELYKTSLKSLVLEPYPKVLKQGSIGTGPYSFQLECLHRNGFPIKVEVNLHRNQGYDNNSDYHYAFIKHVNTEIRNTDNNQFEKQFTTLFHFLPNIACIIRASDGRFVDVNGAFERLTGFSKAETIGNDAISMNLWPVANTDFSFIRHAIRYGQILEREIVVRIKTGECKTLLVTGQTIELYGENHFIIVGTDITKQKRTESQLVDSNRRLLDIIEFLPDAAFVIDADGKVIAWNRAVENMTGVQKKDIIGKGHHAYSRVFYEKEVPILIDLINEPNPTLGKQYETIEWQGETVYSTALVQSVYQGRGAFLMGKAAPLYDQHGKKVGAIEMLHDVTNTKMAEKALAAEKERLAVTLRSIADGVIATDPEGKITLINDAAAKLAQWNKDEAIDKAISEVLTLVDPQTGVANELNLSQLINITRDYSLALKNGKNIFVSWSTAGINDHENNLIGYVVALRDITDRKRNEEESFRISKLESLGTLAGGIAHDFNNLLMVIMGNLSLAKMNCAQDYNSLELLVNSEKAVIEAKNLTLQLLAYAKKGSPEKRVLHVDNLARDTVTLSVSGTGIACDFSIEENIWPVCGDESQIMQAMSYIVMHSTQSNQGCGGIKVTVNNCVLDSVMAPYVAPGKYVCIAINDFGVIVEDDYQLKIFDPYFTTISHGSGLGLATAFSIVKDHGGHITVESQMGTGTCFYIYLPAIEAIEKDVIIEREIGNNAGGRILLMDDEENVRVLLNRFLTRLGYEVDTADDGLAAVKMFEKAYESGNDYQAVILDLTIPGGLGGRETIKILRDNFSEVKAIISTGYSDDLTRAEYRNWGFDDIIIKPYGLQELRSVLEKVLNRESER